MGATAEILADVVGVGAHVKTLRAVHGELDLRKRDAIDGVVGDIDGTSFAFHLNAFAGQFVERHAVFLNGRYHWRDLFEVAGVFIEGGIDLFGAEGRDLFLFEDVTLLVLRGSGGSKSQCAVVNRMELTAAINALLKIKQDKKIKIYTDSKYVKDGIEKWINNWKLNNWKNSNKKDVKNKDLWTKLDNIISKKEITWNWVKAHSVNEYNNKVDFLARNAANAND